MSLKADSMPEVSSDRLGEHVAWLSAVRRDTGGPGEEAAANYIAGRLRDDGIPCTVRDFSAFLSYPGRALLRVLEPDPVDIPCITHSFARATSSEGVVGDLVATSDDFGEAAGRAVMVEGLASPLAVARASRAGVGALIFRNADRIPHNVIVSTVWGTPALSQRPLLPTIPVVSVTEEGGHLLADRMARGRVRVRLTAEVRTGWMRSLLPEVRIPGKAEETFVLLGTHYCAWGVGATDNATGVAALLEIARALWSQRSALRRSIRLCWWPGHSQGRYSGSTWYADTFFREIAGGCIAYHNIDSPGVRGATQLVGRHTTAEMERFCRSIIEEVGDQNNPPIHRPGRSSDQSFLANGVPSFSIYSFLPDDHPDRRAWSAGSAGAWWWHSEEDTGDKADPEILARDARLSLAAVDRLVNAAVLPIVPVDVAQELHLVLGRYAEQADSHIDLQPARDMADVFVAATEHLEDQRPRSDGPAADRFNALVLRLTRILNPLLYSQSGRFHHDVAELLPVRTSGRQSLLPGLSRIRELPQLAGTSEYGFLRAYLVRELNRLEAGLMDAIAVARDSSSISSTP
jgi:hypothetical protein